MATRDAVRPPAQWSRRIETSAPTGSVESNDGDRAVGLAQQGVLTEPRKVATQDVPRCPCCLSSIGLDGESRR